MVGIPEGSGSELQPREIPHCWSLASPSDDDRPARSGVWVAFWNDVGDEQERIHWVQSDEYVQKLEATFSLDRQARVLDFGCGFGYVAAMLADRVGEVALWDASANMRRRARSNVAAHGNIRFLDLSESGRHDPDDLQFDFILVNSVVQYMTTDELVAWLTRWREMLAPGGQLVVSDLIPHDGSTAHELVAELRLSARRGFLVRAVVQSIRDVWHYWGVRKVRPLTTFGRADLTRLGEESGLTVTFASANLTHFSRRLTAVFTR